MGRGAITRGPAPVTAYLHTKIIPLNFSPSLKPEEEGNKRGKRREKLKMNELSYLRDKIATRPVHEQTNERRQKEIFEEFPRQSFSAFFLPLLLVCDDALKRIARCLKRRFLETSQELNGIGRMLFETGNCAIVSRHN